MQILSISSAIHIVTILGFLTHVLVFTYHQLFPQKTSSRLEERKLDDIEFPILFKICLNPAYDLQKLKDVGYISLWKYFVGTSDRASRKTYGWAGINENGTKYATVAGIALFPMSISTLQATMIFFTILIYFLHLDVLRQVSFDVKTVLDAVALKFRNGTSVRLHNLQRKHNLIKLTRPNYPNNCHHIDLQFNLIGLNEIRFILHKTDQKHDIEIRMEDKLKSLSRNYKYNKFTTSRLKVDKMKNNHFR